MSEEEDDDDDDDEMMLVPASILLRFIFVCVQVDMLKLVALKNLLFLHSWKRIIVNPFILKMHAKSLGYLKDEAILISLTWRDARDATNGSYTSE